MADTFAHQCIMSNRNGNYSAFMQQLESCKNSKRKQLDQPKLPLQTKNSARAILGMSQLNSIYIKQKHD